MSEQENQIKLGFGASPDTVHYIFVGGDDDNPGTAWYFWDHATGKQIAIEHNSITGYIKNVYVTKHEWQGRPNYKLNIRLSADKEYCIRSGISTLFSRGILLALNSLPAGSLVEPLTVSAKPGQNNVVFGNLFRLDGSRVFVEWDGDCALLPIVQQIQKNNDLQVQTQESIDNPEPRGGQMAQHNEEWAGPPQVFEDESKRPILPKAKTAAVDDDKLPF